MIIARDKVQALMPHQTLTQIQGEPTHKAIRMLEKELAANLIAVPCPWGVNKGHLGELHNPATFLARNGAPYAPPAVAPPAYPDMPAGATTAAREQLRAENENSSSNTQFRWEMPTLYHTQQPLSAVYSSLQWQPRHTIHRIIEITCAYAQGSNFQSMAVVVA
jgi:hypothetical protein